MRQSGARGTSSARATCCVCSEPWPSLLAVFAAHRYAHLASADYQYEYSNTLCPPDCTSRAAQATAHRCSSGSSLPLHTKSCRATSASPAMAWQPSGVPACAHVHGRAAPARGAPCAFSAARTQTEQCWAPQCSARAQATAHPQSCRGRLPRGAPPPASPTAAAPTRPLPKRPAPRRLPPCPAPAAAATEAAHSLREFVRRCGAQGSLTKSLACCSTSANAEEANGCAGPPPPLLPPQAEAQGGLLSTQKLE